MLIFVSNNGVLGLRRREALQTLQSSSVNLEDIPPMAEMIKRLGNAIETLVQ